jgi:hypothetical protein
MRTHNTGHPLWVSILTPVLGTVGIGVINWIFDYPLYGAVTERLTSFFGVATGGLYALITMSILSWIISYALIRYYDHTGRDLLGLEALKSAREVEEELNKKSSILHKIAKMGDIPAFFVLGLYDPVYATIYLRKGKNLYNGFSPRDWWIFNVSVVYANVLWTSGWLAAIEFIRFIPWLIEFVS